MKKTRRGQGIVEMAILMPFFLLVVVGGIIDFGFAFYNMITVQQLANDAAQWAAGSNPPVTSASSITTYVTNKKPGWWDAGGITVTVTSKSLTAQSGELATTLGMAYAIEVAVRYPSKTYTPFYQTMLKGFTGQTSISLSGKAVYSTLPNLNEQ